MSKFNGPHILRLDVESSLMQFWGWRCYQDNLGADNIKKDRTLLCAAWQWDYRYLDLPEQAINSCSILDNKKRFVRDVYDDYSVVKKLHGLLNDADLVIAHNGDKFDIRFINTRAMYHGLPPIKPSLSVDTLKAIKKKFALSSNSLGYAAEYAGIESTKEKLPFEKWKLICDDDTSLVAKEEAMLEMIDYCEQDVRVLGEFYDRIAPWIQGHPLMHYNTLDDTVEGAILMCNIPHCKGKIKKDGKHRTKQGLYQAYSCVKCGHWMRGKKALEMGEVV